MSVLELLPTSTILHSLSFLSSEDFLELRAVDKWFSEFINGDEADILWRQALVHDFKFSPSINIHDEENPLHFLRSLRIKEDAGDDDDDDDDNSDDDTTSSIFGYSASESVFVARKPYESWKHWAKASAIFCKSDGNDEDHPSKMYINGPYFLRAAKLWSAVEEWCDGHQSGRLGGRIKASLLSGVNHSSGRFSQMNVQPQRNIVHAFEAIFSFHDGQAINRLPDDMDTALLGGYSVYDHCRCTFLYGRERCPFLNFGEYMAIGGNALAGRNNRILLNVTSGELYFGSVHRNQVYLASAYKLPEDAESWKKKEVGLLWLEEYVRRLSSGELCIRPLRYSARAPPIQTISPFPGYPSPYASRRVTRGVEVVASSLSDIDISVVVYSIRIRIIEPGEEGYMTPTERGFENCQLFSRHWRLTDDETGSVDDVNGEGVVGRYPLLMEGGYRDDQSTTDGTIAEGAEEPGTFVYQSCSRTGSGHFEGRMKFFPGSISDSTGPAFYVDVGRFSLKSHPDIWY